VYNPTYACLGQITKTQIQDNPKLGTTNPVAVTPIRQLGPIGIFGI
jgi:hypothetical protein